MTTLPQTFRDLPTLTHVFEMLDAYAGPRDEIAAWLADQGTSYGDNLGDEEMARLEGEAAEVVRAWDKTRWMGDSDYRARVALGETAVSERMVG